MPFRVIHAIDAQRERPFVAQSEPFAERPDVAARRPVLRDPFHVDADGERADLRLVRGARHRKALVVDARLDEAIDGLEKIVAVQLHVKAEQVAAEHAVQDLFLPRADAERFAVRPRNVPEMADDGIGAPPLDHSRQQRKVIVLHEDDGRRALDLFEHGLGELRVDARILLPVRGVEDGPGVGDMAERPQRAVREAVVVALLFFSSQPDAAQCVRRLVRRNGETSALVGGLAIAAAAAVRNPHAAGCAHDRIERGDEAARRTNPPDAASGTLDTVVNVRLAVRDDDDANTAEALFEERDKTIARPLRLATGCIGG